MRFGATEWHILSYCGEKPSHSLFFNASANSRLQRFLSLLAIVMVANGDAPKKDSLSCHHSLSLREVARPGFVQRPTLSYPRAITSPTHCITLHYIILSCIVLHCMLWVQKMGTPTGYITSNPFIPLRHYHLAHSIKVMHRTLFTNILNHIWQDNTKHIPHHPPPHPCPS